MRNIDGRDHTSILIKVLVNRWRILSVKSVGVDLTFKTILVQDHPDERLNTILQFGDMASLIKVGCGGKRWKRFTQDITKAVHQTSNGIVSLCGSSTQTRSCLDVIRGLSRITTKMEIFL